MWYDPQNAVIFFVLLEQTGITNSISNVIESADVVFYLEIVFVGFYYELYTDYVLKISSIMPVPPVLFLSTRATLTVLVSE